MKSSRCGKYMLRRAGLALAARAALLIALLGGGTLGSRAAYSALLTDAEITARADAFLRAVGSSAAGQTPQSIVVDPYRSDSKQLVFPSDIIVSVEARTGKIVRFVDFERPLREETGKRVTKEQALRLAKDYLAIAGVTLDEARLLHVDPPVEMFKQGEPPYVITLTWARIHKGFQVMGDHITVGIDGQSGALLGLGDMFVSRMPADVTPRVSAEQAAAIARNYSGWQPTGEARLMITSYGFPQREDRCAQETRLTWDVRMEGRRAVFVDAVTGEPVGEAAPMGRAEPPAVGAGSQADPSDRSSLRGAAIMAAALAAAVVVAWLLIGLAVKRARTARTSGSVPPASGPG